MRLYVVRHAQAQSDAPTGLDLDRPLTAKGRQQAAWLGRWFGQQRVCPERVLVSGAVRTRETAKAICDALGHSMVVCDGLLPGGVVSQVLDLITEHAGSAGLVVVGHNPLLEQLVATLAHGPAYGGVRMRTGQVVELEVGDSAAAGGAQTIGADRMP